MLRPVISGLIMFIVMYISIAFVTLHIDFRLWGQYVRGVALFGGAVAFLISLINKYDVFDDEEEINVDGE